MICGEFSESASACVTWPDEVLNTICRGNKKQVRKLERYEEVLRKALGLLVTPKDGESDTD